MKKRKQNRKRNFPNQLQKSRLIEILKLPFIIACYLIQSNDQSKWIIKYFITELRHKVDVLSD